MKDNKWTCIICGSKKKKILYKGKRLPREKVSPKEAACTGEIGSRGRHGKIWRCVNCGFVFQEPTFTENELNSAYKGGTDEIYFEQFKEREHLFERCLDRIHQFSKPPGKMLDIGCNAGIFLNTARRMGWKTEGIEPSSWAARVARERFELKVKTGVFEKARYKSESYDIITSWDVLEHFVDPVAVLDKIYKLLKKDGTLVISTIDIDSWFSKLLGPHWPWLIRVHLWYFNSETFRRMVENSGFEVIWMGHQVRWFSLPYLLTRFTAKNFSWLPAISLPAPTGDIIYLVARKKTK
jgi:2-polyprenyl-3-methyl-5-hydroxy-6-metoxy-1,4-benzoquinol methylase